MFSFSDVGMVVHDTEYKCKSYHYSFTGAPCAKDNVEFVDDRTVIDAAIPYQLVKKSTSQP